MEEHPGWTSILVSVQMTAREGRAGPAGVPGGAIPRVTPDDRRDLRVTGGPTGNWRRLQKMGEDCT